LRHVRADGTLLLGAGARRDRRHPKTPPRPGAAAPAGAGARRCQRQPWWVAEVARCSSARPAAGRAAARPAPRRGQWPVLGSACWRWPQCWLCWVWAAALLFFCASEVMSMAPVPGFVLLASALGSGASRGGFTAAASGAAPATAGPAGPPAPHPRALAPLFHRDEQHTGVTHRRPWGDVLPGGPLLRWKYRVHRSAHRPPADLAYYRWATTLSLGRTWIGDGNSGSLSSPAPMFSRRSWATLNGAPGGPTAFIALKDTPKPEARPVRGAVDLQPSTLPGRANPASIPIAPPPGRCRLATAKFGCDPLTAGGMAMCGRPSRGTTGQLLWQYKTPGAHHPRPARWLADLG